MNDLDFSPVKDMHLILENSLFKYSKSEYVKTTLENTTLRFNKLKNYNDVYETEYNLLNVFERNGKEQSYSTKINRKIHKLIEEYLERIRVCCFSETYKNNLMWAHYADNHEGVCYCFSYNFYFYEIFRTKLRVGNVNYSKDVPQVKVFENQTTEEVLHYLIEDIILTKSMEWAYEEEIRFFKHRGRYIYKFNPNCLKAIIIGRKTDDKKIELIKKEIEKFNQKHNTDVLLYYTKKKPSKYELDISPDLGGRLSGDNTIRTLVDTYDNIDSPLLSDNL